jgi:hypothetical protein
MPSSEGVMRVGPLLISSLIAALVMGCGSAPIRTEGIAGPVTWQAMDFQLAKATVNNQPGERYSFTLLLKETRGAGMMFTEIKWTISQHGVTPHDLGPDWSVAPPSPWPVACTILFLMVLPPGIRIMRWSKRRPPMEHHPDRNRRPRSTCSSGHRCGTIVAALLMPLRNNGP